jgi:hypothetical protein
MSAPADDKTKIRASRARQFLHSPQENIWVLLRKNLEKIAPEGDNFLFSSNVVALYSKAQTYFSTKC